MTRSDAPTHKLRKLWLFIGWGLVAFVIYLSLVSGPLPIDAIAGDENTRRLLYGISHVLAYGTLMLWFLQLYARFIGFLISGICDQNRWCGFFFKSVGPLVTKN